jgi:hypothetical protein
MGTRSWELNQLIHYNIGHAKPKKKPSRMKRNMMEQEILLKGSSRKPLRDKGMK